LIESIPTNLLLRGHNIRLRCGSKAGPDVRAFRERTGHRSLCLQSWVLSCSVYRSPLRVWPGRKGRNPKKQLPFCIGSLWGGNNRCEDRTLCPTGNTWLSEHSVDTTLPCFLTGWLGWQLLLPHDNSSRRCYPLARPPLS